MKRLLLATAMLGGIGLMANTAHATPYSFTSSGSFSALSSASSVSSTEIEWGGSFNSQHQYRNDGSTLTANPLSTPQTGSTPAIADQIGSLTWYNARTSSDSTAATVTAHYLLTLNFSQPAPGGQNSETFDLQITNTQNDARVCFWWCSNTGDVNDTSTITSTSPSFIVDGLLISNFSFVESGDGSYNNGVWSNPEDGDSTLKIYANISSVPAPEPGSLVLLSTGLLGLGFTSYRRRSR